MLKSNIKDLVGLYVTRGLKLAWFQQLPKYDQLEFGQYDFNHNFVVMV